MAYRKKLTSQSSMTDSEARDILIRVSLSDVDRMSADGFVTAYRHFRFGIIRYMYSGMVYTSDYRSAPTRAAEALKFLAEHEADLLRVAAIRATSSDTKVPVAVPTS